MSAPPRISLPRFEGPLDLLLTLVRANEVDIADIPIAEITRQYLDYLHTAEQMDVELGAEFIYMAALLIQIKSRCLLARDPEIAAREEDPRRELVRQLLDYEQVRQGAEFLRRQLDVAEATWSRVSIDQLQESPAGEIAEPEGSLNLLQVLRLAQQALATARTYELVTPAESVSVEEMTVWIEERLAGASVDLKVETLLAEQRNDLCRTVLFLALLEMAKDGRVQLEQWECFGPISIVWHNCA